MSKTSAFLEWIYVMNNAENDSSVKDSPIILLAKLCFRMYNYREYIHDENHAWKIILDSLSDLIYPEVVIELPTNYKSVTDQEISYVASFIVYLGYFNHNTSSLDQYTLNHVPEKERLLICSVIFDISAYVGGALEIKELRSNFIRGRDLL
ncbi:hypothetical protein MXB_4675 [Myxobolus squamalis]|nr:hypothetical protein MXB_4675 [Myxobolus squamalis]